MGQLREYKGVNMKKAKGPNGHMVGKVKVTQSKMAKCKSKANAIADKVAGGLGKLKGLK